MKNLKVFEKTKGERTNLKLAKKAWKKSIPAGYKCVTIVKA